MKNECIRLSANNVWIAEKNSDPDALIVKFVICDFGRNKNGISINQSKANNWIGTLVHTPVVGKIGVNLDGDDDFTSHNMKIEVQENEDGELERVVVFDTVAYGTFIDVGIENINGVDCIVATAKVWKRFAKACEIIESRIEEGTLSTSWEIIVEEASQAVVDGAMTKVIDKGRFIGHCLLSKYTEPAYDSSGILSVAETTAEAIEKQNKMLVNALISDITNITEGGDNNMENNDKAMISEANPENPDSEVTLDVSENNENVLVISGTEEPEDNSTDPVEPEQPEVSALTQFDIIKQLSKAIRKVADDWGWIEYIFPTEMYVIWHKGENEGSELDRLKFTYSIDNDKVSLNDEGVPVTISFDLLTLQAEYEKSTSELSKKDEAVIMLDSKVEELNTQLSSLQESYNQLSEFKTKYDAEVAEQERQAKLNEIKDYALKSKKISEAEFESDEIIKSAIENIDYSTIKSIIADRVVSETLSASTQAPNEEIAMSAKNDILDIQAQIITDSTDTTSMSTTEKRKIMSAFLGYK